MTPDDQGFWEVLHSSPPPEQRTTPFLVVDSQTMLLRPASLEDMAEYVLGGESDMMEEYWANGEN